MVENTAMQVRLYAVLCEGYSELALSIVQTLLAEANQLLGASHYQLTRVMAENVPVPPDSPVAVGHAASGTLAKLRAQDVVLVIGGADIRSTLPRALEQGIRQHRRRGGLLVVVASAVAILARCGLLSGERVSCFVDHHAELAALHPDVFFNGNIFTRSGAVLSCAGGMATLDMLFELIDCFTPAIHDALCVRMTLERPRSGTVVQKTTLRLRYSGLAPYLMDAIELMEANIDEVLSIEEVARHCGISKRQLERLFRRHMACSPRQFYLKVRLKRARHRILNSHCSVLDVAFACGFATTAHFSRCYKAQFGVSPREDRQLRQTGGAGNGSDRVSAGLEWQASHGAMVAL